MQTHETHTHPNNPFTVAVEQMFSDNTARPHDVYRLAVLLEAMLETLDDPDAMTTVRAELRALINDLSHAPQH
jgi:hypothetical protein